MDIDGYSNLKNPVIYTVLVFMNGGENESVRVLKYSVLKILPIPLLARPLLIAFIWCEFIVTVSQKRLHMRHPVCQVAANCRELLVEPRTEKKDFGGEW